jgi:hypothetical protein
LRQGGADESHIARTLELPGPIRRAGPPRISTMFPSPAMRCEGLQLATAARFSGQETGANRGRHQLLLRHPVLHQQLPLAGHRGLRRRPGLVPHRRLARLFFLGYHVETSVTKT